MDVETIVAIGGVTLGIILVSPTRALTRVDTPRSPCSKCYEDA
jgi:hypothetical protein